MLYSQIYIFLNGILLAENTTIETSLEADSQDVLTTVKGWAGITPTPIMRVVTANNVIPLPGVEFDFEQKFLDHEEVECMLQQGGSGKKMVSTGYIMAVPTSAGVNQTTNISFTFHGTPAAFE